MDLSAVKKHYADKFAQHGRTPQGMDWANDDAQDKRLHALSLLWGDAKDFSVNDWGCGDGRLLDFLPPCTYYGYDVNPHDVENFTLSDKPTRIADYTVASGLFNVMEPGIERDYWVMNYLRGFIVYSSKGFAFNMLHRRADRKQDGLFYAEPFEIMEATLQMGKAMKLDADSWRVSILQYYSKWDFTLMVHL